MRIAVAREADPAEDRVAATPDTIKKLIGFGVDVTVEPGAGVKSGIPDSEFTAAGANVSNTAAGKGQWPGKCLFWPPNRSIAELFAKLPDPAPAPDGF